MPKVAEPTLIGVADESGVVVKLIGVTELLALAIYAVAPLGDTAMPSGWVSVPTDTGDFALGDDPRNDIGVTVASVFAVYAHAPLGEIAIPRGLFGIEIEGSTDGVAPRVIGVTKAPFATYAVFPSGATAIAWGRFFKSIVVTLAVATLITLTVLPSEFDTLT